MTDAGCFLLMKIRSADYARQLQATALYRQQLCGEILDVGMRNLLHLQMFTDKGFSTIWHIDRIATDARTHRLI